jgi:hypothetical protein
MPYDQIAIQGPTSTGRSLRIPNSKMQLSVFICVYLRLHRFEVLGLEVLGTR